MGVETLVTVEGGPGLCAWTTSGWRNPSSKSSPGAGWAYSHIQKRHVFGFRIVLLFWCNTRLRIPVGFRLWHPKRKGTAPYRATLELAKDLISSVLRAGFTFEHLTVDLWYNARPFTKWRG